MTHHRSNPGIPAAAGEPIAPLDDDLRDDAEAAAPGDGDEGFDAPRSRSRPLPNSLASLRAFEAVARRQGFTKAAAELNLTQTAVSHQVRKLESRLRKQLFIRDREGVRLSAAGRDYLPAVQSALNLLSSATQRVLDRTDEENLSIVSLAAFGIKCLLPLLPDFRRQHPKIRIRFGCVISYDAAASYNYDVSIRYGAGDWPGLVAKKVVEEQLFPVCSPGFAAEHALRTPADMLRCTLISTSSLAFRDDWPEWLAQFGYGQDDFQDWITCDTMLSASQAAIDGLGLAIGRTPLVDRDLEAGRLIEPYAQRLESGSGYYVVSSPDLAQRQPVRLFRAWLLSQFEGRGADGPSA
jgi:LysR family glycine cleavage system transcriptional activator